MSLSFNIAENKERLVLKHFFLYIGCPEYKLSDIGSCAVWDFKFEFRDKFYLGDIKCVNHGHQDHDRILLEHTKLQGLLLECFKTGLPPQILYIFHYSDGYTRSIVLTPEIINSCKSEWITVNTIRKKVYFIPNDRFKLINFYVPEI